MLGFTTNWLHVIVHSIQFSFSPPHSIQFCHAKEWEQVKIPTVEHFKKYKVTCVKWVAWSPTQSKHPDKEAWSWPLRLRTPGL